MFLAAADVARIAALGIAPDTFVETKAFLSTRDLPDVVQAGMFAVKGESAPVAFTVRTPGGRCTFLGDAGCTLGDAKPSFCKVFPLAPSLRVRGLFSVLRNMTDPLPGHTAPRCLALEHAGVRQHGPVTPIEIARVTAQFGETPAHAHKSALALARDLALGAKPLEALVGDA